jgi:hypothetical protein
MRSIKGDELMRRTTFILILMAVATAMSSCSSPARTKTTSSDRAEGKTITIYRSATCSCCKEYESYLTENGFRVESVVVDDPAEVKNRLGVPTDAWSCHTAELGDYVVEGHVPAEVLTRLLYERPAFIGIALPGMPGSAPGMDGHQEGSLHIVSFDGTGTLSHYASV